MDMKELLFDVLDKLQPYEHVEAFIGAHYIPLCKPDAVLPFVLALSYEEEGYDNINNYYQEKLGIRPFIDLVKK